MADGSRMATWNHLPQLCVPLHEGEVRKGGFPGKRRDVGAGPPTDGLGDSEGVAYIRFLEGATGVVPPFLLEPPGGFS